MGIWDVSGTITNMQGIINFDKANLNSSVFDVTVTVNTINTKSEKRDTHLKKEDFFETDKWPTIRFKSTKITDQDSVFTVIGNLTIKDITKQLVVPFTIIETDSTFTFSGSHVINRIDYNVGVDYNSFMIKDEITVNVICVIKKGK